MSFNKTLIESFDYTWNPISGCEKGCSYCYAIRDIQKSTYVRPFGIEPTFFVDRLAEKPPVRSPGAKIFVGSMGDLFGDWDWHLFGANYSKDAYIKRIDVISKILDYCAKWPDFTFIFLTKNPRGMQDFMFPGNCWAGVSVTNTLTELDRINELRRVDCATKFVSFEPLVNTGNWTELKFSLSFINWAIVGLMTGPNANRPLSKRSIEDFVSVLKAAKLPVFLKDTVLNDCPEIEKLREFPQVGQRSLFNVGGR